MRKIGEDEKLVYSSMFDDFDPIHEFEESSPKNSIFHNNSPKSAHVSNLEKHNKILSKAKESLRKKSYFNVKKLEKKIETLEQEIQKKDTEIKEKDKELKL